MIPPFHCPFIGSFLSLEEKQRDNEKKVEEEVISRSILFHASKKEGPEEESSIQGDPWIDKEKGKRGGEKFV